MNHRAAVMPESSDTPDPDRSAEFIEGYNLGYRHCFLDLLALPPSARATLLRQASAPKE